MKFIKDNGLTLSLMIAFGLCLIGMVLAGQRVENQELARHGIASVGLVDYFFSNAFQSALFENWESEFLQMSAYVMMTSILFQRGSSESKDPDKKRHQVDADPVHQQQDPDAPWPVRAGRVWRVLYSYSLGIALALLFLASFVLHWLHSVVVANDQALQHGEMPLSAFQYVSDAQLWFESFQNWQSEFLSTAVLAVLSIVLRFRGSPESKPVAAPHSKTGS
jgi:hypothetical protein